MKVHSLTILHYGFPVNSFLKKFFPFLIGFNIKEAREPVMKSAMVLIHQKKAIQYFETAIKDIKSDVNKLELSCKSLEKRLLLLERKIDPDKEDVYNINRRIDILAQRIAQLESKPKKSGGFFG